MSERQFLWFEINRSVAINSGKFPLYVPHCTKLNRKKCACSFYWCVREKVSWTDVRVKLNVDFYAL